MTAEESVFDGPSAKVRWAVEFVSALVEGNAPALTRLIAVEGDPEEKLFGLSALCVIILRMHEADGGPHPQRSLTSIDGFMDQEGVDLDLRAFMDLLGGRSLP